MKEAKQLGRDSLCRYPDQTGPHRTCVKSISAWIAREIDDHQLNRFKETLRKEYLEMRKYKKLKIHRMM